MPLPTVVIAQKDPYITGELANDLHAHFARVAVANSGVELRTLLLRHEARVAVLDLELIGLEEIRRMSDSFDDLVIVGTHRSPDEKLWMAALNAGAAEFCHPQDIRSILRASRSVTKHHVAIAA